MKDALKDSSEAVRKTQGLSFHLDITESIVLYLQNKTLGEAVVVGQTP